MQLIYEINLLMPPSVTTDFNSFTQCFIYTHNLSHLGSKNNEKQIMFPFQTERNQTREMISLFLMMKTPTKDYDNIFDNEMLDIIII